MKQTLPHNLQYLKCSEIELCIAFYQDPEAEQYLKDNYSDYLSDGRIRYVQINDQLGWCSPRMKNIAHSMSQGRIVFNLDADNFIDEGLEQQLLKLKDNEIIITRQDSPFILDGRIGRIGMTKKSFDFLGQYNEQIGSSHDGHIIGKAILNRFNVYQIECPIAPIANPEKYQFMRKNRK